MFIRAFCVTLSFFLVVSLAADVHYPSTPTFFSSDFTEPKAPKLVTEFRASYIQHKFDVNVNNIASGFLYVSPSQQMVRADAAGDGFLWASYFDFKNVNSDGAVQNTLLSFNGTGTIPQCSITFGVPWIQVFPEDFLITNNAVFAGTQEDEFNGKVSIWQLRIIDLSLSFFLTDNGTLVRYDFSSSSSLRTFATTRFFNIVPGPIDPTIFQKSCL